MLSTPPAFILSQNQTLKFFSFKVIMSFNITTALTFFVISLLTCFRLPSLCRKVNSKKLTEITFYLHCLSNKISFLSYSIFNLLFTERKLGASPLGESLSIIPHLYYLCQAFLKTFFRIFYFSFEFPFYSASRGLSRGQLVYIIISLLLLSTIFIPFFTFFDSFFHPPPSLDFFLFLCYHYYIEKRC